VHNEDEVEKPGLVSLLRRSSGVCLSSSGKLAAKQRKETAEAERLPPKGPSTRMIFLGPLFGMGG
jgi:hypothetical protein